MHDFSPLRNFIERLSRELVPGNAVCVYLDGHCVFRHAFGYADLATRRPMTPDTPINLWSCTKVATAVAAVQLIERGDILVTDPLAEYFPGFAEMRVNLRDGFWTDLRRPITIGDVLSMTAGFDYNFDTPAIRAVRERTAGAMPTLEVVRAIAESPLCFQPGERWGYSLGFDVLGGLVELVSGERFADYVRRHIFEPLGMSDSTFHPSAETTERMATQYRIAESHAPSPTSEGSTDDIVELQRQGTRGKTVSFTDVGKAVAHNLGPDFDSGGAGIVSTVDDYAVFAAALACGGALPGGERILAPGSVELLRTNRLTPAQLETFNWRQLTGYGYGIGVRTLLDKGKAGSVGNVGEFGWGGAAGATVLCDPSIGLGVFYAHHALNPQEEYYQPRLRNAVYGCLRP